MFYKVIVWHNPHKVNKDKYYYRVVTGYYSDYYVGYVNKYGHEIIAVVEDKIFIKKKTIKDRVVSRLINLLNKF